jgi:hypothetical protein
VDDGVLLEMRTVAEEADKDVFCGDMEVETAGHGETDQTCSRISLQFPDIDFVQRDEGWEMERRHVPMP